ncbi:energy-coupling factor transporter transmembrane component T [Mitsuokella multacida]|uniref:energy-coupling factor transporter transmembrane component T n=1 Tax=Mitsuokella multacida TaxID=52226 RepID=UPI0026E0B88A|nr:energy-coupling factor transporter transmembrane component T [Mitsuokella multacida]
MKRLDWSFAHDYLKPRLKGNFVLDLNPMSKANILIAITLSAFVVFNVAYAFLLTALILVFAALAGRFKSFMKVYWKIVVFFASLLFLVRAAFTNGSTVLFQLGGIHVTPEGIHLGLISAALVMEFSGAFILFMETTEMDELVYMLEKKGMSHTFSYIILSAFQTIKDLSKSSQIIMDSQRCRGIETEGSMLSRAKAFVPVLGPLVLGAISNAEEKSIAMDTRAFSAPNKHTSLLLLREVPTSEHLLVWFFDLVLILTIIGRIYVWIA